MTKKIFQNRKNHTRNEPRRFFFFDFGRSYVYIQGERVKKSLFAPKMRKWSQKNTIFGCVLSVRFVLSFLLFPFLFFFLFHTEFFQNVGGRV